MESLALFYPSAKFGAVTRKKNEISKLFEDTPALPPKDVVQNIYTDFLQKLEVFLQACNEVSNLESTNQAHFKEWRSEKLTSIGEFRCKIEEFINVGNPNEVEKAKSSTKGNEGSVSGTSSKKGSKASSSSSISARVKLAEKKAKIQAQKNYLNQAECIQKEKLQLKAESEQRELELEQRLKRAELHKDEEEANILEIELNKLDAEQCMEDLDEFLATDFSKNNNVPNQQEFEINMPLNQRSAIVSGPQDQLSGVNNRETIRDDSVYNAQINPGYTSNLINSVPVSIFNDNLSTFVNPNVNSSNFGNNLGQFNFNKNPSSNLPYVSSVDKYVEALIKQNELTLTLSRTHEKSLLPKKEIETFDGTDLLKFTSFLQNFVNIIEKRCDDDIDKIYYLEQFTAGRAKELVRSCRGTDAKLGYARAKTLLIKEYGNEFRIANAYLQKLQDWSDIRNEDALALIDFSTYLLTVLNCMEDMDSLNHLNSSKEILNLVQKLPFKLREKWRNETFDLTEQNIRVEFKYFVKFIRTQSSLLNQPIFGNIQDRSETQRKQAPRSPKYERSRSLNTNATNSSGQTQSATSSISSCSYCKMNNHMLEDCRFFIEKPLNERSEFVRTNHLCFGCLRLGHGSRGCDQRLSCKTCNAKHSTCLHDESRIKMSSENPATVSNGTTDSSK